jgi:hypothetical protein
MVLSFPQMISGQWAQKDLFKFLDGAEYLELSELGQAHYVSGVVDGYSYAYANNPKIQAWLNNFKGKRADQLSAVVNRYLKGKPKEWHYQMGSLVIEALFKWYPPPEPS